MIKLNNISKFFFKGKPNEIKALQNINLELSEGLVMLVGKSGCGKSTLLNTLGGLEKPDCGSVTIGDTTISRYQCEQWDKLRNREIGYIFQNYNLLEDLTVYQNLELVLKLSGIDPATYADRIAYALSLVHMEKFAKRHPSTLSGGQQQRVGIARAIVKGARVIIADEPTGNLDDTNTIAVMELLKGLSKHCLVVVVTHEEDLATFYADRIIRMKDGQIIEDYLNKGEGSLEHRAADHVYLGDMERQEFGLDNLQVSLYHEGELPAAKVSIVCQNGRILLKVDGESKVTYVTDNSSIVLDQGKYVPRQAEDSDMPIDVEVLSEGSGKPRRIFTFKDCFKASFGRFLSKWGTRRKNPYSLLYNTAVFFVIMIALAGPAFLYDRDASVMVDDHVYAVVADNLNAAELPNGTTVLNKAATGGASIKFDFNMHGNNITISGDTFILMPYSAVGGTAKQGEVYLDTLLYNRLTEKNALDGYARSTKDLIGMPLSINVTSYGYFEPTDCSMEIDMPNVAPNSEPEVDPQPDGGDGQYVEPDDYPYGYINDYSIVTCTYSIGGFVKRNQPVIYLSDADYAALPTAHYYTMEGYERKEVTLLYNASASATKNYAEFHAYRLIELDKITRENFYREAIVRKLVFIILAGVAVVIMLFSLSRNARNEYIGKIKTYAQYRSIGVSRGAIYGKISLETIIISLLTTLRGWAITSLAVIIISKLSLVRLLSEFNMQIVYYPVWFALVCGAFLAVLSQIVNLLTPLVLLSHTPSSLLSKYDM